MFFCLNIRNNWPQSEHACKVHKFELKTQLQASIQTHSKNRKMKISLNLVVAMGLAALLTGCSDSGSSTDAQVPDPTTQPEAQMALFQRTTDRVKGLIEAKDYKQAQETLAVFKNYKLTPEQQKVVDQLQAQIPTGN
jgi:hypothetical protein